MASVTEEKIPSDAETSFVKEKLSSSVSSNPDTDAVKSDAVLDEIAAKYDALNCKDESEDGDFMTEEPKFTIQRQSEVIKKQAETINTLIHQLRIMFDEYTAESQEKEYYEDLSEALLRYIKICDGEVIIEGDETKSQKEEENVVNLISKENNDDSIIIVEGTQTPNPTPEKPNVIEGATAAANEDAEKKKENDNDEEEEKMTITSKELIRLNHILLKEIIELRNERDILRNNAVMSDDDEDDSDFDTEEEGHTCEHCVSTDGAKPMQQEDEEYEHKDVDHMQKIENESDTE